MIVLVTGDRNWQLKERTVYRVLTWIMDIYGDRIRAIRHGAARGVDTSFESAALAWEIGTLAHPADWNAHGKAAGPIRNSEMVKAGADLAIAFHRDLASSRGTRDCVKKCLKAGIPTYLVDGDESDPRLITAVP